MHKKKPLNGSQENGRAVFSNGKRYYYPRAKKKNEYVGSEYRSVECVCPKCGEDHMFFMNWTGRGKPRKYCPNCQVSVNRLVPGSLFAI